jgi:hypothetical protein
MFIHYYRGVRPFRRHPPPTDGKPGELMQPHARSPRSSRGCPRATLAWSSAAGLCRCPSELELRRGVVPLSKRARAPPRAASLVPRASELRANLRGWASSCSGRAGERASGLGERFVEDERCRTRAKADGRERECPIFFYGPNVSFLALP